MKTPSRAPECLADRIYGRQMLCGVPTTKLCFFPLCVQVALHIIIWPRDFSRKSNSHSSRLEQHNAPLDALCFIIIIIIIPDWLTDLEGGSSSSSSSSSSFFSSHCAASSVHRFDPLKEDEIFNAGWIWMRRRRDRGRGKEAGRREDRSKTVDSKMALCSLNLIRRRWIISLLKSPFQRNPRNNGQEVEVLCTTDRSKRNWLRNNCRVTTRISWPPLGSHQSSVVGR